MNFLDKLDYMMGRLDINRAGLSRISGVPYTTIDGFYKKGYDNVKISTIRKIAYALGVSLDYLVDDTITDEYYGIKKSAPTLSPEALDIAIQFDALDARDQALIRSMMDSMKKNSAVPDMETAR